MIGILRVKGWRPPVTTKLYVTLLYRVIHKSLRDLWPLRYSSRDGHTEGEHVNRGRDTPSFCRTLQVLDMSTLGDAADVNPVIKFMPPRCTCVAGSTCKVGQKLGLSLPLLTCSPSAWPSWLLYRRGRKSQRNLWITLYIHHNGMSLLKMMGVLTNDRVGIIIECTYLEVKVIFNV